MHTNNITAGPNNIIDSNFRLNYCARFQLETSSTRRCLCKHFHWNNAKHLTYNSCVRAVAILHKWGTCSPRSIVIENGYIETYNWEFLQVKCFFPWNSDEFPFVWSYDATLRTGWKTSYNQGFVWKRRVAYIILSLILEEVVLTVLDFLC